MRQADITRRTAETDVRVMLNLDGGESETASGSGFFDHMLALFARHGNFGLSLTCRGDTDVDFHHSCEDIGIVLGRALRAALGDCAGINRYGWTVLPMDEALIMVSLDISGRAVLDFRADMPSARVGGFDTELVKEFFTALTREAGMALHIRQLAGENTHHIIEGIFKAFARALAMAAAVDEKNAGRVPSTKGTLI